MTAPADVPHVHGLTAGAWGFPRVSGRCPSCGAASLFLAVGGHVTCSVIGCSNPCAAAELLEATEPSDLHHPARASRTASDQ